MVKSTFLNVIQIRYILETSLLVPNWNLSQFIHCAFVVNLDKFLQKLAPTAEAKRDEVHNYSSACAKLVCSSAGAGFCQPQACWLLHFIEENAPGRGGVFAF